MRNIIPLILAVVFTLASGVTMVAMAVTPKTTTQKTVQFRVVHKHHKSQHPTEPIKNIAPKTS
ncbi:hypothetical protein ACW5XW_07560 [Aeromonas piscicola]|uniref:hypothetical protein n=1 Tax=Aeromonas piscicola TaxID=600645 RepID=UPI0009E4C6C6|nr:hypothetical protein [Aeromonas piscicola]